MVDDVLLLLVVDRDAQRGLGGDTRAPRAIVVSLAKAPRLVRFSLPFSTCTLTWPRSAGSKKFMNRSTCMLAYQMSISGMVAKVRIRER